MKNNEQYFVYILTRIYLRIGFLCFFVIPGMTRNPVTLPFYDTKTENYEVPICDTQVAGYRLEFTPYSIRGRYDVILR